MFSFCCEVMKIFCKVMEGFRIVVGDNEWEPLVKYLAMQVSKLDLKRSCF